MMAIQMNMSDVPAELSPVIEQIEHALKNGLGVLFLSPPGYAPLMLARRIDGLLPPLSSAQSEILFGIESRHLRQTPCAPPSFRPFRAPHNSVSITGMCGNPRRAHLGEVELASFGVLYLDDLPDFHPAVIAKLRESIRALGDQAPFVFGSAHLCLCGKKGLPHGGCICRDDFIERHMERVEQYATTLDMLQIQIPYMTPSALKQGGGESSAAIRARLWGG